MGAAVQMPCPSSHGLAFSSRLSSGVLSESSPSWVPVEIQDGLSANPGKPLAKGVCTEESWPAPLLLPLLMS